MAPVRHHRYGSHLSIDWTPVEKPYTVYTAGFSCDGHRNPGNPRILPSVLTLALNRHPRTSERGMVWSLVSENSSAHYDGTVVKVRSDWRPREPSDLINAWSTTLTSVSLLIRKTDGDSEGRLTTVHAFVGIWELYIAPPSTINIDLVRTHGPHETSSMNANIVWFHHGRKQGEFLIGMVSSHDSRRRLGKIKYSTLFLYRLYIRRQRSRVIPLLSVGRVPPLPILKLNLNIIYSFHSSCQPASAPLI